MNKRRLRAFLAGLPVLAVLAVPAQAGEHGETLFKDICAACHGTDGTGIAGIAPPLVDPVLWSSLGDKAPVYFAGVVTNGLSGRITAQGIDYIGLVMPSQAAVADADLAAIGAYVLQDLNGVPDSPTEAEIASAKATPQTHKALRTLRAESGL